VVTHARLLFAIEFGEQRFEFLDGQYLLRAMQHRMTVGANRPQIFSGIYFVPATCDCKWFYVVNVNKVPAEVTVSVLKKQVTHTALKPPLLKASRPHSWVAFVRVYAHEFPCPL
jgi:hypothetical protein